MLRFVNFDEADRLEILRVRASGSPDNSNSDERCIITRNRPSHTHITARFVRHQGPGPARNTKRWGTRLSHDSIVELAELVEDVLKRPGPFRLVTIDGPGGSGKSTFADRLSAASNGAPIVHADDFASADNPIDWWPRLLEQVIEPLADGRPAVYQRYDWPTESLAE